MFGVRNKRQLSKKTKLALQITEAKSQTELHAFTIEMIKNISEIFQ